MTRNGPNQANYDESIANPDPDLPDPLILNVSRAEYDLAILGGGRRGRRNGCYLGSPLFSQTLKGRRNSLIKKSENSLGSRNCVLWPILSWS